jgi:translation initiation factor IF-3
VISNKKLPKANKEIKSDKVRLVGQDGEMIGVLSLLEALNYANKEKLDLVEISPQINPPVCKLMDFGKYKYDLKKKSQTAKKKQKKIELKEIKLRPNIGQADFDVKLRKIKEILSDGNRVKVTVWFKGREIVHSELGKTLLSKVIESTLELGKIETGPKMEGSCMVLIICSVVNKLL